MSDIFGISVSALQAFQKAVAVTGNNIANASTPGYSRQSVELATKEPQRYGNGYLGSGVDVITVRRSFDQAAVTQRNNSQSALGQINSLKTYTDQLDNLFGTTGDGLSAALKNFFGALSDVANDPASTSARQALLGHAQTLTNTFRNVDTQLDAANNDINAQVSADVSQINSTAQSIAQLNRSIVAGGGNPGQVPNDLLDQRDELVHKLADLTGVTTTQESNGSINVFVGNGQGLVLQDQAYALGTAPSSFDPTRLEVTYAGTGSTPITGNLTGGALGGALAARASLIDPVRNQLGQLAYALADSVNTQQRAGLDLNGALGADFFSVQGPQTISASGNASAVSLTTSIANVQSLTADAYTLRYSAGAYVVTRASDGAAIATTGAGTAASPLQFDGLSIVASGTPTNGDRYQVKPTALAAATIGVALTSTAQVAAAGAVRSSASAANAGTGSISAPTVLDSTNANFLNTATIAFTSSTTYSVNGAGSFTYAPGANIDVNGSRVQISGAPAAGDAFVLQRNTGGAGDNRNALALANVQNLGVLTNGTVSVTSALSSLVTSVGTKAQQTNTAQSAQVAINSQAEQKVQSVSGVNLDEEAAALLQWQQSYQAAAQALKIGSSLFDTVLAALRAG